MPSKSLTCTPLRPVASKVIRGWNETAARDHFVQFYRTDEYLVDCLASYFAEGIFAGESAVVIATADHARALQVRLLSKGIDVNSELRRRQLVWLDADDFLARIVHAGQLKPGEFHRLISDVLRSFPAGRPVRCFGELVALLWMRGDRAVALELEQQWNVLGRQFSFRLFCAYPSACMETKGGDSGLEAICRTHSHLVSLPV